MKRKNKNLGGMQKEKKDKKEISKRLLKAYKLCYIIIFIFVLGVLFYRPDLFLIQSNELLVLGFVHKDIVYGKLGIKLDAPKICNITAKYGNHTVTKTFFLNKSNVVLFPLPNMPYGKTKVLFKMKCLDDEK